MYNINKLSRVPVLTIIIWAFCFSFLFPASTQAAYSTGFENANIHITSPDKSGLSCNGKIILEGTSSLDTVWFCIRGPQQEISTAKASVSNNGYFKTTINLRFGSGQYTIWAGNNSETFDGSIRFIIINENFEDTRYTSPSTYVDSDHPAIVRLAGQIVSSDMSDRDKMEAIHRWVTSNIRYDYDAYINNDIDLIPASKVLEDGKGLCRDFSFLYAALGRASGLATKVVYGEAESGTSWELHAWNEVLIDNKWVAVDASWDSGYVNNNRFIQSPSNKYLDPDTGTFALTHKVTQTTVH